MRNTGGVGMRIIAGTDKGRKLFAPEGVETRPTADRVRESLFNILGVRVMETKVLDLFAGSGALALEALSRGAAFATLSDNDPKACRVIERNIQLMRAEDRTNLIRADWRDALRRLQGQRFSLVFLDPPYRMLDVYALAAEQMRKMNLLAEGATLVMEHALKSPLALPAGFEITDERRYGDTAVALVREKSP
jgi:16S rRNA (guanine966-N2)-methyltransferase